MTIGETTMIEENEQEVEVEDQEQDYGSDVETMIAAIQQKNLQQAKNHFEDIIGDKVHVSLEAEKVRLAEDAEWEDITAEIEDSLEQ